MNKKATTLTIVLAYSIFTIGCAKSDGNSTNVGDKNLTNYTQESVNEDTYNIDTTLDRKEHTFKMEDERPIIEAFTEATQGMNPESIKELFKKCGDVSTSEIYTIEPSEYEMFNITVVNDKQEEVTVTYKDGSLISKEYKKDAFNDLNQNMAFVNYKSNLFKQEYSSGIYGEETDKNVAKNKNVWEIEEELFKIFN